MRSRKIERSLPLAHASSACLAVLAVLVAGCAAGGEATRDTGPRDHDASPDASPDAWAAPDAGTAACASAHDCADGIACTIDACEAGTCAHRACVDCCDPGLACVMGVGCAPPPRACTSDADCSDGVRCTLDRCASGSCTSTPENGLCAAGEICQGGCIPARGACTTDADCVIGRPCDGRWRCGGAEFGCEYLGPLGCDDGNACTADACADPGGCTHVLVDVDHDGHAPASCGGDDCDDTRADVLPGAAEVCDGIDQDCDGAIDESLGTLSCGTGVCHREVPACMGGVVVTCDAPAGSAEVCDGMDQDCDGVVDEGIAAQACGVGACARSVPGCTAGVVPACMPRLPVAEACNGIDDDCDGTVDDGIAMQTCGVGACARSVGGCVAGAVPACMPASPSIETCNAIDDDCDGTVDDGIAMQTCGVGACLRTAPGCVAGSTPHCTPGTPLTESCNGVDDDCDGRVDEAPCMRGWSVAATGPSGNPNATVVDASGNAYVAGSLGGTLDFGAGPLTSVGMQDVFLASYDPTGALRWARRFGTDQDDWARAVAVDARGNVFITGFFGNQGGTYPSVDFGGGPLLNLGSGDVFVASFDPSGAHRWSRRFGGPDFERGDGIGVDAAGNVYVTGEWLASSSAPADFGAGTWTPQGGDGFVTSLDNTGHVRWAVQIGGTGNQYPWDIAVDAAGNASVVGNFDTQLRCGASTYASNGSSDVMLVRFDASGALRGCGHWGGPGIDEAMSVAITPGGGVVLGGMLGTGSVDLGAGPWMIPATAGDAFVLALDGASAYRWAQRISGPGSEVVYSVSADGAGNVLAGGAYTGTTFSVSGTSVSRTGSYDALAVLFGPTGALLDARSFGTTGSTIILDTAWYPDWGASLVGYFSGAADFGFGALSTPSLFVVRRALP